MEKKRKQKTWVPFHKTSVFHHKHFMSKENEQMQRLMVGKRETRTLLLLT